MTRPKVIFLDRDGVINKYPGDKEYVTRWKDFRFLPGVKRALARLHKRGLKVFIVSNQAGVGKGFFTRDALDELTGKMLQEVEKYKGKITAVYYCTHRPQENCNCRKPKAGLLYHARRDFKVSLRNAYFIGDTIRDVHTARVAGCKSILVLSGKEKSSNRKSWEAEPDYVFKNLSQAADFILKE